MVKFLTRGLRGFNGAVQHRLATLTVTMLISSCWQLSSEVELRRIFDACKRWANSGSHEFVKKNMVRYMRPHGRFAHYSCKNAVRQPPVLASCIEIYYFIIFIHILFFNLHFLIGAPISPLLPHVITIQVATICTLGDLPRSLESPYTPLLLLNLLNSRFNGGHNLNLSIYKMLRLKKNY